MISTRNVLMGRDVGQYEVVCDAPMPTAEPGWLVCKVAAVALNPTDWKMADFSMAPGAVGGHDFAGEVVEVGVGVTRFKKGDRVFAVAPGLNPDNKTDGAFGDYASAHANVTCKIPEWMSYEEACTLGVGIGTTLIAIYQKLGLPVPKIDGNMTGMSRKRKQAKPVHVLVAGGATATGTLAIQLLKVSGLFPIATCSRQHMEMVKSLGAVEAFDYSAPQCGAEIRTYTNNTLAYAFDCISEAATMKMCYEAIGIEGGKYVGVEPLTTSVQYTRREVQADWVMAKTLLGRPVRLGGVYGRPASEEDYKFAEKMFPVAERLILNRALKPHPMEIRAGGLGALVDGIDDLRKGRVRGKKLVYQIAC